MISMFTLKPSRQSKADLKSFSFERLGRLLFTGIFLSSLLLSALCVSFFVSFVVAFFNHKEHKGFHKEIHWLNPTSDLFILRKARFRTPAVCHPKQAVGDKQII